MRRLVLLGAAVAAVVVIAPLLSNRTPMLESRTRATPTPAPVAVAPRPQDPAEVAAAFITSFTPRVLLDPSSRSALLDRWADPDARPSLNRSYAAEADRVRATYGGAPAVARSALLGYRVVERGPDRLDVAIWAVGVAAGRVGTGASGWTTVTVTLRRRAGAWRVQGVHASPGPAPSSSARALAHASARFRPFHHAR